MTHPGSGGRTGPPPVPAARRRDGSDGLEHAQPGSDRPTLCGIPAGEVVLYRHLFTASNSDDCPRCAELIWRLETARLAAADQVIVFSGAGFNAKKRRSNERLRVEHSSAAIAEVAGLLTDFRPGEGAHWMEWPAVSIAFLDRRRLIAEFGLLSGLRWVRTPTASDREIRDPERLRDWLSSRGVDLG